MGQASEPVPELIQLTSTSHPSNGIEKAKTSPVIEGPMTPLQSTSHAYLRSGSPAAREHRGDVVPDPRPYLITGQRRKSVASAQKYLSLFPHEAEDARLTGSTRSLFRRLLALNLPGTTVRVEERACEVVEGLFGRSKSKIA